MARSKRASATKPAAGVPPETGAARDSGPCAALEAEADRRCQVAAAARTELAGLTERLAGARAEQADRRLAAAAAQSAVESGDSRTARSRAQADFEAARQRAGSADAIAEAGKSWLAELERVGAAESEAASRWERERAVAEIATAAAEHLVAEVQLAQRAAEAADQACVEARGAAEACAESVRHAEMERLAADAQAAAEARASEASAAAEARASEASAAAAAASASRTAASDAAAHQAAAHQAAAERALGVGVAASGGQVNERARSLAASTPLDASPADTGAAAIGAGGVRAVAPGTAIHRILSGDLAALSAAADAMGDDAETRRRWEVRLTDLLEAILLRAVDASAIGLPPDHSFWGVFTAEQSRDIMSALSALGCRFDGLGGWLDDRVPTQRDLSIAVAHAGLDPMRIRHWPTVAEAEELVRDAEVLGGQYLNAVAPGLTLREMTSVLGPDAVTMADVLLEWERIRELLLAGEPADGPG